MSFGAIAALVIGTAPLDKIGEIDLWSWRFFVALGGMLLALVAVALVIAVAAAVDAPVGLTSEQLRLAEENPCKLSGSLGEDADGIKNAAEWIKRADLVDTRPLPSKASSLGNEDRVAGQPANPISYLLRQRDKARDRWLAAQNEIEEAEDPSKRSALAKQYAGREARLTRLDEALDFVVRMANYHRINSRFSARKPWIIGGALVASIGIVAFKYAVHFEEEKSKPPNLAGVALQRAVGVDFRGASLAGAQMHGADLRRADLSSSDLTAADLSEAKLTGASLKEANLSAADLTDASGLKPGDVQEVTWVSATCPDGIPLKQASDTCATTDQLTPRPPPSPQSSEKSP